MITHHKPTSVLLQASNLLLFPIILLLAFLLSSTPLAAQSNDPTPPLPKVLLELPIAPPEFALLDFLHDAANSRIYLTDSTGQLIVLDANTYQTLARLSALGYMTLDASQQRLYVAPRHLVGPNTVNPTIAVIDTATLQVSRRLLGAYLSLDFERERLYVGQPLLSGSTITPTNVLMLASETFDELASAEIAGIPLYNPWRNELLILSYSAYRADLETLAITGDLLPELSQTPIRWCTGCQYAASAQLFTSENLLMIDVITISTGKGPGYIDPPRFFDATTLQPVANPPSLQPDCGGDRQLRPTIAARTYRFEEYSRYVTYANLLVYDSAGKLITWRDGLGDPFVNPTTKQAYIDGTVYDLAALVPVGRYPALCFFAHDQKRGLLFGTYQGKFVVMSETGGEPPPLASSEPITLTEVDVRQIVPSPDFLRDHTLFLQVIEPSLYSRDGQRIRPSLTTIYRSTDAGKTWLRLHGGLPNQAGETLTLAISPNFGQDRTLFVGAAQANAYGQGVWRSQDAGDTWQPVWQGLTHLRVYAVGLSPRYASDSTLFAYANYYDIRNSLAERSLHRSTDGGLQWSLVMTGASNSELPDPASLVLGDENNSPLPVRKRAYAAIETSADQGATWQTIGGALGEGEALLALFAAPAWPQDPTIYVLTQANLWRTTDAGRTWSQWGDERLAGRTSADEMSAGALLPIDESAGYHLLLGTRKGELWELDPAQMSWRTVNTQKVATPLATSSTPTATQPVTASSVLLPTPTPQPTQSALPTTAVTTTATMSATAVISAQESVATNDAFGTPPPDRFSPPVPFLDNWQKNAALQSALGWALAAQPNKVSAALQRFEHGLLLWHGGTRKIYVLYEDGAWQVFDDAFVEGQPEKDLSIFPPQGRYQPIRGFGKIWRDQSGVRDKLGWAIEEEAATTLLVLDFERGVMIVMGSQILGLRQGGWWPRR